MTIKGIAVKGLDTKNPVATRGSDHADFAAKLNTHVRTLLVGHKTKGQKLDCLRSAMYRSLNDDDFVAAIKALKRPLAPLDHAATSKLIDQIGEANKKSDGILAEILAPYQK